MSRNRIPALDEARRYLFTAENSLNNAARELSQHATSRDGLKEIARTVSSLARQIGPMKDRVRKVHEAAVADELGNGGKKSGGWSW